MVRSVLRVLVGLVAFVVVVAKGVTRAFLAALAHAVAKGRWAEKAPVVLLVGRVAMARMANWANQVQKALADCQDQQAAPAAPGPKDHVAHKVRKIVRLV